MKILHAAITIGLLLPIPANAQSQTDQDIFYGCILDGYPTGYCLDQIQNYHNEKIPNGTTILRGDSSTISHYRSEDPIPGTTIFRGR